jgi:hypothetical protein
VFLMFCPGTAAENAADMNANVTTTANRELSPQIPFRIVFLFWCE